VIGGRWVGRGVGVFWGGGGVGVGWGESVEEGGVLDVEPAARE
jgi:hypothetical protein